MEYDAPRGLRLQPEHLKQMPGDGLSLAVFIGCEPYHLGLLGFLAEVGHQRLLVVGNLIFRFEAVGHVDAEIFLFEVADVAVGGGYYVVRTKEFSYGLCLGRRLDYDEVFCHLSLLFVIRSKLRPAGDGAPSTGNRVEIRVQNYEIPREQRLNNIKKF